MPFAKIDIGILDSTLWLQHHQRDIFLTAILMAQPCQFKQPLRQLAVDSMEYTGYEVPPGWYGFVAASAEGIIHRAVHTNLEDGIRALKELGEPEATSRSAAWDGRRMVRVDGGYIVLNLMAYRDRDYSAAARMRAMRARRRNTPAPDAVAIPRPAPRKVAAKDAGGERYGALRNGLRDVTQAEGRGREASESEEHSPPLGREVVFPKEQVQEIPLPSRRRNNATTREPVVAAGKVSSTGNPKDFFDAWNRLCGSLPKVVTFSQSRRDKTLLRIREGLTLETFEQAVRICTSKPFLRGEGDRGWQASFDWLMANDRNVEKAIHDYNGTRREHDPGLRTEESIRRRAAARRGQPEGTGGPTCIADLFSAPPREDGGAGGVVLAGSFRPQREPGGADGGDRGEGNRTLALPGKAS